MLATGKLKKEQRGLSSNLRQLLSVPSLLMVEVPQRLRLHISPANGQTIFFTHRQFLDDRMLDAVRPDVIVTPLMAQSWDLLDLGTALVRAGYRGRLCALTEPLPRIDLVMNEISRHYPKLAVSLLEIGEP